MEKFKELVKHCKCSVSITVNDHKDVYQTVQEYLDTENYPDIEQDVLDEMIKRDTIVLLQAYPKTPIGFYRVYHYDIEKAVDLMLEFLTQK